MGTIELSYGIFKAPDCIAEWYKELKKNKDGSVDLRRQEANEFTKYIANMDYLAIQALSNNIPFRLMTRSEWFL